MLLYMLPHAPPCYLLFRSSSSYQSIVIVANCGSRKVNKLNLNQAIMQAAELATTAAL